MGWTWRQVADSLSDAMEEHRKEIGRRIAGIREQRGLTQEDLAHAAGLTVKTLSRLENGHHEARATTVRQIAEALGVEPHDITGQGPMPLGGQQSQLDRIEAMLALLLRDRGLELPVDPGEQFAREIEADVRPSRRRAGSSA